MSKAQKHHTGAKLSSVTVNGTIYKVGDAAFVKGADSKLPFIGKIRDIREISKGGGPENAECTMAWYYRPEEAEGGRKQFHGEKELFKSEHVDPIAASTITGKCRVLTLKQYQFMSLRRSPSNSDNPAQNLENIDDADFYARFTYMPAEKEFKPDRVPVYCSCEMPYNPDQMMVMCKICEEWYHPKCLGMQIADVEAEEDFVCAKPECQSSDGVVPAAPATKPQPSDSGQPASTAKHSALEPPSAKPKNGKRPKRD